MIGIVGLVLYFRILDKQDNLEAYNKADFCEEQTTCKSIIEATIIDRSYKNEPSPPTSPGFSAKHPNSTNQRNFITINFLNQTDTVEIFIENGLVGAMGKVDIELWRGKPTIVNNWGNSSPKTIYHPEIVLLQAESNLASFVMIVFFGSLIFWGMYSLMKR